MGYYINTKRNGTYLPARGKADILIAEGAKEIQPPITFQPGLICVVNNGPFEAAGHCYSEQEMREFNDPFDRRPKRWLVDPEAAQRAE